MEECLSPYPSAHEMREETKALRKILKKLGHKNQNNKKLH